MKNFAAAVVIFLCAFVVPGQAQSNALKINPTGNIAIGLDTADEKLVVNGNIKAVGNLIGSGLSAAGDAAIGGNLTVAGGISSTGELKTAARVKDKTGFVMPVGSIMPYAITTAPQGWLICDGSVIDKSANPELTDLVDAVRLPTGTPMIRIFRGCRTIRRAFPICGANSCAVWST